MFKTLKNAWSIPELRKKLIFTAMILLIFCVGGKIPVPYIDVNALSEYYNGVLADTIFNLYNAMTGSAFSQATVFALGIQPYINASIIIQLLTIAIPALERLSKEGGEEGKKTIERITRYTTVGLGLLMGWAYYAMLKNYASSGLSIITEDGFLPALVIILAFAAGSTVVMWLGEQITQYGIGNGISMILFANIICRLPGMVSTTLAMAWWQIIVVVVGMAALILLILFVIVEAACPIHLVSIWFAAGSLVAMIAAALGAQLWLQVVLFLVVSAGLLAAFWPFVKRVLNNHHTATNLDRVIGSQGYVTAPVDNLSGTGTVKLDGMEWTARSSDGSLIPSGTLVRVDRIEGVKVFVTVVTEAAAHTV